MIWRLYFWHFKDYDVFDFLDNKPKGKSVYGGRIFHPASASDIAQALGRTDESLTLCFPQITHKATGRNG